MNDSLSSPFSDSHRPGAGEVVSRLIQEINLLQKQRRTATSGWEMNQLDQRVQNLQTIIDELKKGLS